MIGAAVLAAGASRRLGTPKQLLWVNGRRFVRHAAECALGAVDRVAVVVGHESSAIARTLGGLDIDVLANPIWSEGIASSIRTAASWAASMTLEALILMVSDQPYLETAHLRNLCARFDASRGPVASAYARTLGVPALFPAHYYRALWSLQGDEGAARMLHGAAGLSVVEWPLGAIDVDTDESARAFRLA